MGRVLLYQPSCCFLLTFSVHTLLRRILKGAWTRRTNSITANGSPTVSPIYQADGSAFA